MRNLLRLLPILALAAACCALLFQRADLTNTDLGRHLKNGEIVLSGSPAERSAVLHTNFFSFAAPDYPFVNHHWLTGVVFYLVFKLASFPGLAVFYTLLVVLALAASYWAAQSVSNAMLASALVALAVPIVAWRDLIRPEGFTYLFTALFYWVLLAWSEGWIRDRALAMLPALMLLWINLHIGFVFGFLILAIFGLHLWASQAVRSRWKAWGAAAAGCLVASMLNPSGIHGLLYPFGIFGNYGYDIAENLSLSGVDDRKLWSWTYDLFLALLGLSVAVIVWRWFTPNSPVPNSSPPNSSAPKKSGPKRAAPLWPQALLLLGLGLGGVLMVRNQPLFCLLMVPILARFIADRLGARWGIDGASRWIALAACAAGLFCVVTEIQERSANSGLDQKPGNNAAAQFLRSNGIAGPLFNDFDIGGYLIYNGYQVFVDGRPEAYPPGFFENSYIPALSDDAVWARLDHQYHFNAIVISMQDGFPPIEKFILTRVRDAEWAPVYTDPFSLIFVRRTDRNAAVIQAHLIPRSAFR